MTIDAYRLTWYTVIYMCGLSAARAAQVTAQIVRLEARRDRLETDMENMSDVESYQFNSGEGSQQTKYRSIAEMERVSTQLDAKIDRLYRKLYGTANFNMNMRRKAGC